MFLQLAIVVGAITFACIGKLKYEKLGRPFQLKCLSKPTYLFRHFQTLMVMFKTTPPLKILSKTHYQQIATTIEWTKQTQTSELKTLLVVIPGLTGGSHDNYVAETVRALEKPYTHVCVYNYALMSPGVKKTRIDIMGNLRFVLEDLGRTYGRIHCVGFSYGANQLLYYLGHTEKSVVQRAAIVSNPFNLSTCSHLLDWLHDYGLTSMLKTKLLKLQQNFSYFDINWQKVQSSKKLTELDQHFTIKVYGFDTVEQYYKEVSSGNYVDKITTPVLSISSRDDAISKFVAIRFTDKISYLVTDKGGHNAFLDWRMRFWFLEPVREYLGEGEGKRE